MRRLVLLVAVGVLVAAGILGAQRLSRNRQYFALLTTGDQARAAGHLDAAIEAYSGALALHADSMIAYLHRGQVYRDQHHDEAAIRDLERAALIPPAAPQPLEALGDLFDERDAPAQAAAYYARFVALDPSNAGVLFKLGLARYRSGAPADAIPPLRSAVALRDSFGEAHYLLGLALRDTDDTLGATAELEHALHVDPSLTAAREELADLYAARGRRADEMVQLQNLASRDPGATRTVAIALAQAQHGDFDGAVATLSPAARGATPDATALLALGRVYLAAAERRRDQPTAAKALDALQRAAASLPRRSATLALVGRARYLSGDIAGAERTLRDALTVMPVAPEAFGYLADVCEHESHFDDARDALTREDALEGDTVPDDIRGARLRRLGALSLTLGDTTAAVTYLQGAVAHGRHDGATLAALADAAWRAGQPQVAREALAQATLADPNNPSLARLRATIK